MNELKANLKKLQDENVLLKEANSDRTNSQIAVIASLEDEISKLTA